MCDEGADSIFGSWGEKEGLGIRSMEERAYLLGGRFRNSIRRLGREHESKLGSPFNGNPNWLRDELASNGVDYKRQMIAAFNLRSNADLVLFRLKYSLIAVNLGVSLADRCITKDFPQ